MKRFNEVLRQDFARKDETPNCYIEHVPSLIGSLCYFDEVQQELNTVRAQLVEERTYNKDNNARVEALLDMNRQLQSKIAQLKESEDDLNEQVRCQAAAITRHLAQRDADRDHIDDLTQQVKSLQAALDERDEELERQPVWPKLDEDPGTRTNQLINALYHDRARLEKALKRGAFLANQYKDVLAECIKLTDKEGKEHPDLTYASGLLSEWCHVNG